MKLVYKDFEITGSPEDICFVIDHIQYESALKHTFAVNCDCSQMTLDDIIASPEVEKMIVKVD